MRLTRVVGATGKVLMAAGVLILLFVAYELWGTGLHEAKAQGQLDRKFAKALSEVTTSTTASTTRRSGTTTTLPAKIAPEKNLAPAIGDPVGRIEIPKLGLNKIVVQGVALEQLDRAPGHYPETPFPGQAGNASIAGHRTTYGAPFYFLDHLVPGDKITITTLQGRFTYSVQWTKIVLPDDVWVLRTAKDHPNTLTLTACHPLLDLTHRLVVRAVLDGKPVAHLPGQDAALRKLKPSSLADGIDGTSWDRALPATIAWGLLCAAIWLVVWLAARRWRRRPGRSSWAASLLPYLIGLPVFLGVLFVFYENLAQVLPAGL